jgi:tetratricopeptide (TPR) repeat protein
MRRRAPALVITVLLATLLSAAACGGGSADARFKQGNEYFDQNKLEEAAIEYRAALQLEPNRGDIRHKLGDTFVRLRNGAGALQEYVRAADLRPHDVEVQLKAGSFLLLAGQFEDAKGRAEKALALDPKHVQAQILLGNALAGLKEFDAAIAEFQQAIALDPAQDRAYTDIGAIQFAKGQRAEAEAAFRKAIEVAPKSVESRLALANFLWSSNRIPEAEQTLKDALAAKPDDLTANRALGLFYVFSNRAPEAEPYFQAIAKQVNSPAATLSLADYYLISRRPDDARKLLQTLAQDKDFYATATTRLAALDASRGERAQALAKLRELIEKQPKEMPARLLSARLLVADGKLDEALEQAQSITKDDPNSKVAGDAYFLIGSIHGARDRYDDATKAFEEVLKRETQPLPALIALSALQLQARDAAKATTYAQQALAIQPKNPNARALLVRIAIAQGNMTKAREELASLQKEFPSSPAVLKLQGAQLLAEKKLDAARAAYAKAAQLAPNDIEAAGGLAPNDLLTGKGKDAVAQIEARLKTTAPTSSFLILAAQTYGASGNVAKAEEMLKKAIELDPARLQAYTMLGTLYLGQKRIADAKEQFQEIVNRNPKSVAAHTMLAMLLEFEGKTLEAEQAYQRVLAINPRAPVAANNLAWILVASGRNLDQALQLAQAAQQQLTDEPHVNDTLGWIYYHKDMAPQAIRHLESSIKVDPSDPTVHYHLGMAYLKDGQRDKARKELERALAANAKFDGIDEARKALASIK